MLSIRISVVVCDSVTQDLTASYYVHFAFLLRFISVCRTEMSVRSAWINILYVTHYCVMHYGESKIYT